MELIFSNNKEIPYGGIFLAGPTKRNSKYSKSWRKEAVDILKELGYDGIVYIPEYEDTLEFDDSDEGVGEQTEWEWEALGKSRVIVFWVPRNMTDMMGFTTNTEFGKYTTLRPDRIVLGYPDGTPKMRYMKKMYNDACNKDVKTTLKDTLAESLEVYGYINGRFRFEKCKECIYDKTDKCRECLKGALVRLNYRNYAEYEPVCPRGYTDCISDPAYIKKNYPDWYSELYGDKTPYEAAEECRKRMEEDPDEEYYCYDDEDK